MMREMGVVESERRGCGERGEGAGMGGCEEIERKCGRDVIMGSYSQDMKEA